MAEIISSIVIQHAEEAAFLWSLRGRSVSAPHYSLSDLAQWDDRLEAHLDGLRVAGDAGWDITRKALSQEEPGELFAVAVGAFESANQERIQEVLDAGVKSKELSRGLVSALGWMPFAKAEPDIRKLMSSDSAIHRRVGIAASAIHRQDPGTALERALDDADCALRSRALRAVGELGRTDLLPRIQWYLPSDHHHNSEANNSEECQFWAAWTETLLGGSLGLPVLKGIALSKTATTSRREQALVAAMRRMDLHDALSWREELAQQKDSLRLAIVGAGAIGNPTLLPWLIEQMRVPEVARIAGDAFTMITGVDIAHEDLDREKPEGFEAGPTDRPEDEDVAMDPDENLPWPAPDEIHNWCIRHESRFVSGVRYLAGQPIDAEWLQQVLGQARQRQRAAAAFELAVLTQGRPLFEVRSPGFRQKQLLQSADWLQQGAGK